MADAYRAVAPDPDHFDAFAAKASGMVDSLPGWSNDELRQITAPVLVMIGDQDFIRVAELGALPRD